MSTESPPHLEPLLPLLPMAWNLGFDGGADANAAMLDGLLDLFNASDISWFLEHPELINQSISFGRNASAFWPPSPSPSLPHPSADQPWLMRAVDYFSLAYIPVIVAIGMVSNLTCIIVFMTTYFRKLSLSYYLTALSTSNIIFLSLLLVFWVQQRFSNEMLGPVLCKLTSYLTFITRFLSDWYTVAFTVERYIAVVYPLRRATMCTVHRAKLVIVSLAVFSLIFHCLPLLAFSYDPVQRVCDAIPGYSNIIRVFEYCDTILHLIIPYFAIFTLNIFILRKLRSLRQRQGEILFRVRPDQCTIRFRQTMGYTKSTQLRFTKMLLITSFTTLLLSGPSYGLQLKILIDGLLQSSEYKMTVTEMALLILFQDLYYANFSINFLLYSLGGSNFRKVWRRHLAELLRLCCCCCAIRKARSKANGSNEMIHLKEALVHPLAMLARRKEQRSGVQTVTELLSPVTPDGHDEIRSLDILFKVDTCATTNGDCMHESNESNECNE